MYKAQVPTQSNLLSSLLVVSPKQWLSVSNLLIFIQSNKYPIYYKVAIKAFLVSSVASVLDKTCVIGPLIKNVIMH